MCLKTYLPRYLSNQSQEKLFGSLSDFPDNIDQRIYTSRLKDHENLYQGDGVEGLLFINFPSEEIISGKGMIISNTCDNFPGHERVMPIRISYVPIFNLNKYELLLRDKYNNCEKYDEQYIDNHISDIRKQYISHLFFLPSCAELENDSFVSLDRINNCSSDYFESSCIPKQRIFSLSDYGFYLFLFKLSVHLTRVKEKVERD